jgi:TPR repeat protein
MAYDYHKALRIQEATIDTKNAAHMFSLAMSYAAGADVERFRPYLAKAEEWLKRAADAGNEEAKWVWAEGWAELRASIEHRIEFPDSEPPDD